MGRDYSCPHSKSWPLPSPYHHLPLDTDADEDDDVNDDDDDDMKITKATAMTTIAFCLVHASWA